VRSQLDELPLELDELDEVASLEPVLLVVGVPAVQRPSAI